MMNACKRSQFLEHNIFNMLQIIFIVKIQKVPYLVLVVQKLEELAGTPFMKYLKKHRDETDKSKINQD